MHPRELVRRAIATGATGRTAHDISRELGVPERTVAHWIRGDRRDPAPRPTGCPRCSGQPLAVAYSYLLGTYLGDGHITVGHRTACLWICCADDRPGVRAEVEDAVPPHQLGPPPRHRVRHEYPRYFFSNESRAIIDLCAAALDRLGIAYRLPKPNTLSVARREAVAALDEHVGPKH